MEKSHESRKVLCSFEKQYNQNVTNEAIGIELGNVSLKISNKFQKYRNIRKPSYSIKMEP